MISFYPGPSKLNDSTGRFFQEAIATGILSYNHRSPKFTSLMEETIFLLKEKLLVPENYTVFFVSSATECWEIIAQDLVQKSSVHLFNGNFGEKWMNLSKKLLEDVRCLRFGINNQIDTSHLIIPDACDLIALTDNETSNGTCVTKDTLEAIRKMYPDKLIASDATSSMAGVHLDFSLADVWFASVQKCFGLPSGMALMICSPEAIKKAKMKESRHYNSISSLAENISKYQTTHTPNILNIFLLNKTLKERPDIISIDQIIRQRADSWYSFFETMDNVELLISNEDCRSKTVIVVQGTEDRIATLKLAAEKEGFVLGNGYGKWAKTTWRIANFPAYTEEDIFKLKGFLRDFYQK
ncbi:aminotransferase class V-fold PLP-dependent enzyme [Cytophagaceae bacterium ABcell3]|nr:aminotransferase class V-fold PLP-dependent enzyme [Cytophagaceae bacterium ABcell3]